MSKRHNEYAAVLGKMFEECPKAVLAAIAVSALTVGGDYLSEAQQRLADEWLALFEAGIVPQKPSGIAAKLARSIEERLR
jgi:hypothetical protein